MSAVLQAIEAQPADNPDAEERVGAAIYRVLSETPMAFDDVTRLIYTGQSPSYPEKEWVALIVQEAAMISAQPMAFPLVQDAPLPPSYLAACQALKECERLDECHDWQNKAAALSSYARQARDSTLSKFARRIEAHATRRCGELLFEIPQQRGRRTDLEQPHAGSDTRLQTAADAGMSARQMHTALRVATVPAEVFNAMVEGDEPPKVPALANLGTRSRPPALEPRLRTPAQRVARSISHTLRKIAAIADRDSAVREAFEAEQITTADLRQYAADLLQYPARKVVRPVRGIVSP